MADDDVIRPGDVQAGDLVFLTAGTDPLDTMVSQLDGGEFSHVGIADGAGSMISARTGNPASLAAGDIGGVWRDSFVDLAASGRELHAAPVRVDDAARAHKDAFVLEHLEGRDGNSRSGFSTVKLFMIGAGLNTFRTGRGFDRDAAATMWHDVLAAAEDWAASSRQPNFFCSEFVAAAYDQAFPESSFAPPRRVDLLPEAPIHPPDPEEWLRRLADEAPSITQSIEVVRLLWDVWRYDRAFLGEAAHAIIEFVKAKKPSDASAEPERLDLAPRELPTALVTPRMIRDAGWVEPTRRIDLPVAHS